MRRFSTSGDSAGAWGTCPPRRRFRGKHVLDPYVWLLDQTSIKHRETRMHKPPPFVRPALVAALVAGTVAGVTCFFLSIASLLMTYGDGTAPTFTYVMLWLNRKPQSLLGTSSDRLLLVAAFYCGVVVSAITFIGILLSRLARDRSRS